MRVGDYVRKSYMECQGGTMYGDWGRGGGVIYGGVLSMGVKGMLILIIIF